MKIMISVLFTALLVAACASSTTTQLANNIVRIDVSAAPACGKSGALKLVNKMAAVETIRLGFDRYYITAMDAQNNVRVVGYNSSTYGSYGYGNFNANTYNAPIYGGSQDAAVNVVMFRANDPEAKNAIDARRALGADWQNIVAEGAPNSCT